MILRLFCTLEDRKCQRSVYTFSRRNLIPRLQRIPSCGFADNLQHLDFNDDFIFLSGPTQFQIISRHTGRMTISYPPTVSPRHANYAQAYSIESVEEERHASDAVIDLTEDDDEDLDSGADDDINRHPSRVLDIEGHKPGEPGYKATMSDINNRWIPAKKARPVFEWYGDDIFRGFRSTDSPYFGFLA